MMSETSEKNPMMDALLELRCHFTWDLLRIDIDLPDLEIRILDEIEFLETKFDIGIYNTLAYVKHLKGQNEEALKSLRKAEERIQEHHDDEAENKSLVTWGNYAWIYYHMGRLSDAQTYLDKVEACCKRLHSPFSYKVELPEIDCEEGWVLLKFGKEYYESAKVCFQKALESEPDNPEFNTGFAIAMYRLNFHRKGKNVYTSLEPLKRAVELNPEDAYIKVLLALELQRFGQEEEGEQHLIEAVKKMSSQPYILRYAAKFYSKKGYLDEAINLLHLALKATPLSAVLHHQVGVCYTKKVYQIKNSSKFQPRGKERQELQRTIQLAISHFKTAIELRPTFEASYIDLGQMYEEEGDYNKAEESFQKILNMKQLHYNLKQNAHYQYGNFLIHHRRSETAALAHYLEGLKIDADVVVKNRILNALERLAKKLLQKNASDVECLSLLGFVHKTRGKLEEAIKYYERALGLDPGSE